MISTLSQMELFESIVSSKFVQRKDKRFFLKMMRIIFRLSFGMHLPIIVLFIWGNILCMSFQYPIAQNEVTIWNFSFLDHVTIKFFPYIYVIIN